MGKVLAGIAASLLLGVAPLAWAASTPGPNDLLLQQIGPGWSATPCPKPSAPSLPRVCFRSNGGGSRNYDSLIIQAQSLASGIDPQTFVGAMGPSAFDVSGLEIAHGDVLEVGGRSAVAITMYAGGSLFNLVLDSERAPQDAESMLLDVARGQQAAATAGVSPSPTGPSSGATMDAATRRRLDDLLLTLPANSGLTALSTFAQPNDLAGLASTARSRETLDLVAAAPTRTRAFGRGGVPVVAVDLWEQPYDVFAAAGLATFAGASADNGFAVDSNRLPDAVGMRLQGAADKSLAIVFRKGRYVVFVLAPSVGPDENAAARALTEVARLQAARLPAGATRPYFFPSTQRSVIVTATATTVLCGGVLLVGPLAGTRRRRRGTGSRPSDREASPRIDGAAVTDVDDRGAALRRRGLVLAGVDVVAVNLIVMGTLGVTGVLQLPAAVSIALVVIGALGGILFTLWWARADHQGGSSGFARELQPSFEGIAAGLFAVTFLVLGVTLVVYGLANLAFGPSLSVLERSQAFHMSPTLVAVGALVGGSVLLVAGGFVVRLARVWARAGAARLRSRDTRPPILYLRSFEDDALRLPIAISGRRPFLELFAVRRSDLFEESIAWQVAPYGPVVAIARPGRPTQSLGAARELLPDETWQHGVAERMNAALAIVVIVGATEGLRWELSELVSAGHLTRTVFVFPPAAEDVLRARWDFTAEALAAARGEAPNLPAQPERALAAVIDDRHSWHVAVADVRDEANYRVALDDSLGLISGMAEGTSSAT